MLSLEPLSVAVDSDRVAEIEKLEAQLRCDLPPIYRSWLVESNGGVPSQSGFSFQDGDYTEENSIEYFYGICTEDPDYDIRSSYVVHLWMLREDFVPIALADGSCYVGIHLSGRKDNLYYIDYFSEGDTDGKRPHYFVASNILMFLDSLYD